MYFRVFSVFVEHEFVHWYVIVDARLDRRFPVQQVRTHLAQAMFAGRSDLTCSVFRKDPSAYQQIRKKDKNQSISCTSGFGAKIRGLRLKTSLLVNIGPAGRDFFPQKNTFSAEKCFSVDIIRRKTFFPPETTAEKSFSAEQLFFCRKSPSSNPEN